MTIRTLMLAGCALATLAPMLPATSLAASVPTRLGQCVTTRIAEIGTRLEGVPDSGDALRYENGIIGISYDVVPELHTARAGDTVQLCLTFIPDDCPPDDNRGMLYQAFDKRTGESWELPNAAHMCGGA